MTSEGSSADVVERDPAVNADVENSSGRDNDGRGTVVAIVLGVLGLALLVSMFLPFGTYSTVSELADDATPRTGEVTIGGIGLHFWNEEAQIIRDYTVDAGILVFPLLLPLIGGLLAIAALAKNALRRDPDFLPRLDFAAALLTGIGVGYLSITAWAAHNSPDGTLQYGFWVYFAVGILAAYMLAARRGRTFWAKRADDGLHELAG